MFGSTSAPPEVEVRYNTKRRPAAHPLGRRLRDVVVRLAAGLPHRAPSSTALILQADRPASIPAGQLVRCIPHTQDREVNIRRIFLTAS